MSAYSPYIPSRAMFVFAHPDDIEFGTAGTAARWIQAGAEVIYILLTSGDGGIADTNLTRQEVAAIREREQLDAAQAVGVRQVIFFREPDGLLVNSLELRRKLVREIRRLRPEVVVCGDPTAWFVNSTYVNHPDHRAAAAAAIESVFPAAGQPHVFEELAAEGLTAHKVRKLYVEGWGGGDTWIDITNTIDLKIAALRCHTSQMREWDPEPMLREWSAEAAKGKEMAYAETFRVITLVSDEEFAQLNNGAAQVT